MNRPMESGLRFEHNAHEARLESVKEFIKTYHKIQKLRSWLIEAGPGADVALRGIAHAKLSAHVTSLGFDPSDPTALRTLDEVYADLTARIRAPQPVVEVPELHDFYQRIAETVAWRPLDIPGTPYLYEATLEDVVAYGTTDWSGVTSCDPRTSTPQYIRGVATIMADPEAYYLQFDEPVLSHGDRMAMTPYGEIANGRHRALAAICMGQVATQEMQHWVPVSTVV